MRVLTHLDRLEAESHPHHARNGRGGGAPGHALFDRQGFCGDAAPCEESLLPAPLPFPLLHVDTSWKFREMYALRDKVAADRAINLIIYKNPEAERLGSTRSITARSIPICGRRKG